MLRMDDGKVGDGLEACERSRLTVATKLTLPVHCWRLTGSLQKCQPGN